MGNIKIQFRAPNCPPSNGYIVKYKLKEDDSYTTVLTDTPPPIVLNNISDGSYEGTVEADYGDHRCLVVSFTREITTTPPFYAPGEVPPINNPGGPGQGEFVFKWGYSSNPIGDPIGFNYQYTQVYAPGSSFTIDVSNVPSGSYIAILYPSTEPIKGSWFNTPFNNGTIPDAVWNLTGTIGGVRYITSRVSPAFDKTQPLIIF